MLKDDNFVINKKGELKMQKLGKMGTDRMRMIDQRIESMLYEDGCKNLAVLNKFAAMKELKYKWKALWER